jgi:hypothetical protein
VWRMANKDVLKFDAVTRQPLYKCLTLLTFEKQKAEIEIRQIKKQNKQW